MRKGDTTRKTKETDISVSLNLDGTGENSISTGIGFFDHMLQLFAYHGKFDIKLDCTGDINVDAHHTVEDVGITLGKLFKTLLGDKCGINRYATSYVPMDESLARCVVDLSGRPFLVFKGALSGKSGEFDAELCEEFFRAFSTYAMITIHIEILDGSNLHHMLEAIFKSAARALSEAIKITGSQIPSSKGILE